MDPEHELEHKIMEQKSTIRLLSGGIGALIALLLLCFYMIANLINEGSCHVFNVRGF